MKLKESQIAKIDPLLQQILEQADGNEIIRTVMVNYRTNSASARFKCGASAAGG